MLRYVLSAPIVLCGALIASPALAQSAAPATAALQPGQFQDAATISAAPDPAAAALTAEQAAVVIDELAAADAERRARIAHIRDVAMSVNEYVAPLSTIVRRVEPRLFDDSELAGGPTRTADPAPDSRPALVN